MYTLFCLVIKLAHFYSGSGKFTVFHIFARWVPKFKKCTTFLISVDIYYQGLYLGCIPLVSVKYEMYKYGLSLYFILPFEQFTTRIPTGLLAHVNFISYFSRYINDYGHWRSDHSPFENYLSHYNSDLDHWRSDHSHFKNYLSYYKSYLGHWRSDQSHF